MNQVDIYTAILTKVSEIAGLPTKIYENVKPPTETPSEYLEVYIMPIPNVNQAFSGVERKSGLIQINVVVEPQKGSIRPVQIADIILANFKNGTIISDGLRVSKPSYTSGGITYENRYVIPVTIQYENISS